MSDYSLVVVQQQYVIPQTGQHLLTLLLMTPIDQAVNIKYYSITGLTVVVPDFAEQPIPNTSLLHAADFHLHINYNVH